jgi:hypothetical protein
MDEYIFDDEEKQARFRIEEEIEYWKRNLESLNNEHVVMETELFDCIRHESGILTLLRLSDEECMYFTNINSMAEFIVMNHDWVRNDK